MLPQVGIASRGTTDWEKMLGDDRVRCCGEYKLNVYNLAVMTSAEAERLMAGRDGRLCARLY